MAEVSEQQKRHDEAIEIVARHAVHSFVYMANHMIRGTYDGMAEDTQRELFAKVKQIIAAEVDHADVATFEKAYDQLLGEQQPAEVEGTETSSG